MEADDEKCGCGHTAHWHGEGGRGGCEAHPDCPCRRFEAMWPGEEHAECGRSFADHDEDGHCPAPRPTIAEEARQEDPRDGLFTGDEVEAIIEAAHAHGEQAAGTDDEQDRLPLLLQVAVGEAEEMLGRDVGRAARALAPERYDWQAEPWNERMQRAAQAYGQTLYESRGYGERIPSILEAADVVPRALTPEQEAEGGPTDEGLARRFHETYEALAPQHDYLTRTDTRGEWENLPSNSRALMVATVAAIRSELASPVAPEQEACPKCGAGPMKCECRRRQAG